MSIQRAENLEKCFCSLRRLATEDSYRNSDSGENRTRRIAFKPDSQRFPKVGTCICKVPLQRELAKKAGDSTNDSAKWSVVDKDGVEREYFDVIE